MMSMTSIGGLAGCTPNTNVRMARPMPPMTPRPKPPIRAPMKMQTRMMTSCTRNITTIDLLLSENAGTTCLCKRALSSSFPSRTADEDTPPPVPISQEVMKVVLLIFLETLGNRAPARRREDRRERAFRDADEASLDDPAQPPSMAARQRAPDPPVEPGWTRMGRESAFPARGERRAAARGAGGGQGAGRAGAARRGRWTARGGRWVYSLG